MRLLYHLLAFLSTVQAIQSKGRSCLISHCYEGFKIGEIVQEPC